MPMAVFALISWMRNPYGDGSEVKVNRISGAETVLMCIAAIPVTVAFYFILKCFGTSNLLPSTFSVSTSFLAAYLTFRRSPYYALAYAFNDVVLIVLWSLASFADRQYISVLACFVAFLFNDIYGFISWQRMKKRQAD
jgi:nicotinamide mononucleotide transporter PnuC